MQESYKQVDKYIVSNKILGKGQFGTVYRGFIKDDLSKQVAVKVIPLNNVSKDQKFIKLLKREIEILMKIKNNYVVGMHHATRTQNNLYMFLEYCNEGDLKELLKKRNGKLTESEAVGFFRQICEGFRSLYKDQVIHRDIKPANILIKDGKAMISDFGFARCLDQCGMEEQTKMTYLGTPLYMAPQILMEDNFSSKCDIWSLGMLFYEILYGRTPWTGQSPYKLYKNIQKEPLLFPENPKTSDLAKDMIKKMLVFEENERISWPDLLEHPLIKLDFNEVQKKINEINANNEIDPLLRSVEVNSYYCNNNKVMGLDKQQQLKAFKNTQNNGDQQGISNISLIGEEENSQQQKESMNQTQSQQPGNTLEQGVTLGINLEDAIIQQEEQSRLHKTVIKIDSYLTFYRNIGIFINLTTNYIFKLHQNQVISLPQHLFFRIIFVLQKKQLIGFQHLLNLIDGNLPDQENLYSLKELEHYQGTKQYKETKQVITNDNGYVKPYFLQIFDRTKNFLEKHKDKPEIVQFFQVLDKNLSYQNTIFDSVYNDTLNEFLQFIQQSLSTVSSKKRDLLQTTIYVFICKNPLDTFKWNKEENNCNFHEFYDKFDNMSEDLLVQQVKEYYENGL